MTTTFIGTTFPPTSQWHIDEVLLINKIQTQIDQRYLDSTNLFINTTWFGPQFQNDEYTKFTNIIAEGKQFDRIFLLAAADPVFLTSSQIEKVVAMSGATETFLLGHFDSEYQFNFHSTVLPKYFYSYANKQLAFVEPKWVFLNYNRKPRDHRIRLVDKIFDERLNNIGIVTLGHDDSGHYGELSPRTITLDEDPDDYAKEGNWGHGNAFGIPHDIHSLGNMNIWQRHFLTIVGETEYRFPDHMFVSEKTWKPIIGLRPFVINGQTKIYSWLQSHGFRTFNHWFPVELETVSEARVQDSIVNVIKYLKMQDLTQMYQNMLPDLLHNQQRFVEFSKEQQHKMEHLFN